MLRRFASVLTQSCRQFSSFKSELVLKWKKPEQVACYDSRRSGDLEVATTPPRSQGALPFALSTQLAQQPEPVQAIFSVGHAGDKAAHEIGRLQLADRVRQHKYDNHSMEVKLAIMTGKIRGLQVHLNQFPRDGASKALCKELIDKRKKYLKYLRSWDYKRFEWVLEKLQLEYKPPPPVFRRVTRKQSISKLKDIYCEEVKAEKMAEYKLELIAQRDALLKEYAENPLPPLKIKAPDTKQ